VAEKSPAQVAAVQRLREWAISPTGGGKLFNWGTPGDFRKCQLFYADKLPAHMIDGWCSNLHRLATGGFNPGDAPGERTKH
jgi:hypothetical protein